MPLAQRRRLADDEPDDRAAKNRRIALRLTVSGPPDALAHCRRPGAMALQDTFEALVFDWDGPAVPDRGPVIALRDRIEALCEAGVHVFVVSAAGVRGLDGRLHARPRGRGRLHLCCSGGSEVFEVTGDGPVLVWHRIATPQEDEALDRAAAETLERLGACGLEAQVAPAGLNRRRIDVVAAPARTGDIDADAAGGTRRRRGRRGPVGAAEVVGLAADAARSAGLADPRVTGDVARVEIALTDASDAARFAARWLGRRGIAGTLVLIGGGRFAPAAGLAGGDTLLMVEALARAVVVSVGGEPGGVPDGVVHLGGGPRRFLALLDAQLRRRAAHRVPPIDLDPAWVVVLPAEQAKERVAEALGALGNGFAATRGSREEDGPGASPLFLVSGVYTDEGRLLPGPIWTGLRLPRGRRHHEHRLIDLRSGTLVRAGDGGAGLRSIRFVSAATSHAMALRAEAPASQLDAGDPVRAPREGGEVEVDSRGGVRLARTGRVDGGVAVAARDRVGTVAGHRVVERLAAWVGAPDGEASFDEACQRLAELDAVGFDALLAEHRETWARRWGDAEVVIEGDPESELGARFAVFQLLSAAVEGGELAIGARGLTGDGYAGHVFWDADVFVLPALAAMWPAAARAMLEYRIRRLPAACATARGRGLRGARFPWESAGDGTDVTPRKVRGRHGELIPIATGAHEEHIVADVAWAAWRYATWTGDDGFLSGAGRDLVVETARYWASRIRLDPGGRAHIYGVMGPDEYHEVVDDNAYTNVMARWNLRRGADLVGAGDGTREAAAWRDLADALVDGWHPVRQLYEQFAGYFELEPLVMAQVAPPPVTADILLGAARVARSQLIKQADVLMFHHLVPDEVVPGSLAACLAFYEPRTAHGSSLSPAISASLLARAGEPDRALDLFRIAARIDLDDLTGTTAGGLHLATMGGLWQALAYGFLGLRAEAGSLAIAPSLPATWSALGLRFRFRGRSVAVRAAHDRVTVTCDEPLVVRIGDRLPELCRAPGATFVIEEPHVVGSRP